MLREIKVKTEQALAIYKALKIAAKCINKIAAHRRIGLKSLARRLATEITNNINASIVNATTAHKVRFSRLSHLFDLKRNAAKKSTLKVSPTAKS